MRLLARRLLIPAALLSAALPFAFAGASGAQPVHAAITATVATTLATQHYAQRPFDDTLSAEWFDTYLERLDYSRLFFLQADIDEFSKWRTRLDDDVESGHPTLEAATAIHDRFLQRLRERTAFAIKELAANKFDFSDEDATVDIDRHEKPWAKSVAELDAIWRSRIAEEVLRLQLGGDTRARAIERTRKRYERRLADRESYDEADVLEIYLAALAGNFDPHSVWFKPISKENFDIDMRDSLTGIGAVLNMDEGYTVIRELVVGGPAEASGQLSPGDRIVAVAQGDAEPVDVVDMRLDHVVKLIRGPVDSEVVLTIWPGDATDPATKHEVRIVRDKVKLDRAAAKGDVREIDGKRIGIIEVPSFYVDNEGRRSGDPNWTSTTKDTARILKDFESQGVEAVVVDLRMNGGGALDQAIDMTGLFLAKGPVVQIRDSLGRIEVLEDEDPRVAWDGPLVVLTSEGSASASEIFAAAIQDYGRGLVVGSDTTHGKGSVQNLVGLDRMLKRQGGDYEEDIGGALKFTTHMFFRINGESTQLKGVNSDVVIPSPLAMLDIKESDLDKPLPFDSIDPARYRKRSLGVDVEALQAASQTRVKQSMDFAFLEEDLMERARLKERETISLDEDTRRAEIERNKTIEDARKRAWAAVGANPEEPPDAVLEEALRITSDMLTQLHG